MKTKSVSFTPRSAERDSWGFWWRQDCQSDKTRSALGQCGLCCHDVTPDHSAIRLCSTDLEELIFTLDNSSGSRAKRAREPLNTRPVLALSDSLQHVYSCVTPIHLLTRIGRRRQCRWIRNRRGKPRSTGTRGVLVQIARRADLGHGYIYGMRGRKSNDAWLREPSPKSRCGVCGQCRDRFTSPPDARSTSTAGGHRSPSSAGCGVLSPDRQMAGR